MSIVNAKYILPRNNLPLIWIHPVTYLHEVSIDCYRVKIEATCFHQCSHLLPDTVLCDNHYRSLKQLNCIKKCTLKRILILKYFSKVYFQINTIIMMKQPLLPTSARQRTTHLTCMSNERHRPDFLWHTP